MESTVLYGSVSEERVLFGASRSHSVSNFNDSQDMYNVIAAASQHHRVFAKVVHPLKK